MEATEFHPGRRVGVAAGFASGGRTWLVYAFEDVFAKLPFHYMWWPVLGGLFVGLGGFAFPRAGDTGLWAMISMALPVVEREHPTTLLGYLGRKGIAEGWEDLREEDQVREAGWITSRTRLFRSKTRRVLTESK